MSRVCRYIVLVGLTAWLGHAMLTGRISSVLFAGGQAQNQAVRKPIVLSKAPLRFIKDPNPSFSGVAVDSDHNMLIVTDENLFQILEYGTKENTPTNAKFS